MALRKWQVDCSDRALNAFELGQKHFLCLATPGAGKTIMAAEIARRLLDRKEIDYIFCFSPSITTSKDMRHTLESMLNVSMMGLLGCKGSCVTYQSLMHKNSKFWDVFRSHRVFAIFDEIHHCGGNLIEDANVWAMHILMNIKSHATFTLALSGTPWRSDQRPVTLSHYSDADGKLHCDFEYGLAEAIKEKVCRTPQVTIVDNKKIKVKNNSGVIIEYNGIEDLLNNENISYQSIIETDAIIDFCLENASKKLNQIRRKNPAAAGLIIASTVEHARLIADKLQRKYKKSVKVVSYKDTDSQRVISEFQKSDVQWLVSVGMVSEGTNLPRLQVCCHLTRIKTELHFRQILGRIIRRADGDKYEKAHLFVPAQPQIVAYAKRLDEDLPNERVMANSVFANKSIDLDKPDTEIITQKDEVVSVVTDSDLDKNIGKIEPVQNPSLLDNFMDSLSFSGQFTSTVVRSAF